jgi:hypothetical protein
VNALLTDSAIAGRMRPSGSAIRAAILVKVLLAVGGVRNDARMTNCSID